MTATILMLAGAYAFTLAVLVGIFAFARVRPVWLVLTALITAGLFVITYREIGELRGLPSDTAPPEFFQLHWARVIEPNALSGETGRVFLWLEELDQDNYPSGLPRAYTLPYTNDLVRQIDGALAEIKEGKQVAGRAIDESTDEDTAQRLAAEVSERRNAGTNAGSVGDRVFQMDFGELQFGALPAPVTPEKPL